MYESIRDLRKLLVLQQWREADLETEKIIFDYCNYPGQEWLRPSDIDTIPLEILASIEKLWLTYSKGRFGFSIQHEIYKNVTETVKSYSHDFLAKKLSELLKGSSKLSSREAAMLPYFYRVEIGWIDGHPMDFLGAYGKAKDYDELTFNLTAPPGHFPCLTWWTLGAQAKNVNFETLLKEYGILGQPGSLVKYSSLVEIQLFKRVELARQRLFDKPEILRLGEDKNCKQLELF